MFTVLPARTSVTMINRAGIFASPRYVTLAAMRIEHAPSSRSRCLALVSAPVLGSLMIVLFNQPSITAVNARCVHNVIIAANAKKRQLSCCAVSFSSMKN